MTFDLHSSIRRLTPFTFCLALLALAHRLFRLLVILCVSSRSRATRFPSSIVECLLPGECDCKFYTDNKQWGGGVGEGGVSKSKTSGRRHQEGDLGHRRKLSPSLAKNTRLLLDLGYFRCC